MQMVNDFINRKMALAKIFSKPAYHGSDGIYYHSLDIKDALNDLPSAQSQQEIYRIVLDDLLEKSMYRGVYDAENGDDLFMYGIFLVMQFIAYRAGEEVFDAFTDEFFNNMTESERAAKQRERN